MIIFVVRTADYPKFDSRITMCRNLCEFADCIEEMYPLDVLYNVYHVKNEDCYEV